MKSRNGFVSNSSSSSFIGYGWSLDREGLEAFLEANGLSELYDVDDLGFDYYNFYDEDHVIGAFISEDMFGSISQGQLARLRKKAIRLAEKAEGLPELGRDPIFGTTPGDW